MTRTMYCDYCRGDVEWDQGDAAATVYYHHCGRAGTRLGWVDEAASRRFHDRLDLENRAAKAATEEDPADHPCRDCGEPAVRAFVRIGGTAEWFCEDHRNVPENESRARVRERVAAYAPGYVLPDEGTP